MSDENEDLGSNLGVVPEDALDHDNSGKKGGSLKGAQSTASKGAAKKKKASGIDYGDKTWIILEENDDIPPTGLPISHNGRPFLIMPGEPVEVPNILLEILDHAVLSRPVMNPQTKQVIGYTDQRRFPYRKVDAPDLSE